MAQQAKHTRQKNILMTPDTEDRVVLLSHDQGISASAVMRQALIIGLEQLDPQGAVSRYAEEDRRALARSIRIQTALTMRAARARSTEERGA